MKKYNTLANTMFSEPLPEQLSPTEITQQFIKDYFEWRQYAYAESKANQPEKDWNIGKSYDNLIIKYCGVNKKYQGLAYGSKGEALVDTTILEETINGDTAIVKTTYQDPEFTFLKTNYNYHFVKDSKTECWLLSEKYFIDDAGEKHPYL